MTTKIRYNQSLVLCEIVYLAIIILLEHIIIFFYTIIDLFLVHIVNIIRATAAVATAAVATSYPAPLRVYFIWQKDILFGMPTSLATWPISYAENRFGPITEGQEFL